MGTFEGAMAGRPKYRLFDSNTVALAAFICSPLAGVILIAANYVRLGKAGKAVVAVAMGVAATSIPVLIKLTWSGPGGSVSSVALGLLMFLCTWQIAKEIQGEAIEEHIARGGRLGRGATAFFVGIVTVLAVYGVASGVRYETQHPGVVRMGSDQVVYSGLATKGTAVALGEALKARRYFVDRGATVLLERGIGSTTLSFEVQDGGANQAGLLPSIEAMALGMAPLVGGLPIELKLVDSRGDEEAKSTVGEVEFQNGGVVTYEGMATKEEAEALGGELESLGYFREMGAKVFLLRHDDEGTVVAFVAKDEAAWTDAKRVSASETMVREAAPTVGGFPVVMRILNQQLDVERDELIEP